MPTGDGYLSIYLSHLKTAGWFKTDKNTCGLLQQVLMVQDHPHSQHTFFIISLSLKSYEMPSEAFICDKIYEHLQHSLKPELISDWNILVSVVRIYDEC